MNPPIWMKLIAVLRLDLARAGQNPGYPLYNYRGYDICKPGIQNPIRKLEKNTKILKTQKLERGLFVEVFSNFSDLWPPRYRGPLKSGPREFFQISDFKNIIIKIMKDHQFFLDITFFEHWLARDVRKPTYSTLLLPVQFVCTSNKFWHPEIIGKYYIMSHTSSKFKI